MINIPPLSPKHALFSKFSWSPIQIILDLGTISSKAGQLESSRQSWLRAHSLSWDLIPNRAMSLPHPLTTNRSPFGHGTFCFGRRAILILSPGTISSFRTMMAISYCQLTYVVMLLDVFAKNKNGSQMIQKCFLSV